MSVKTQRLQHVVLRTQSVVTYRRNGHANASQASKVMVKNFVQILMNVQDLVRAESIPNAKIFLETSLVFVVKDLKAMHMMDVLILMNALMLMLVDRVLFVQILKVVIAATAQKDLTETPDQQDALIIMNVHVHHVDEMLNVRTKLARSDVSVQKDL